MYWHLHWNLQGRHKGLGFLAGVSVFVKIQQGGHYFDDSEVQLQVCSFTSLKALVIQRFQEYHLNDCLLQLTALEYLQISIGKYQQVQITHAMVDFSECFDWNRRVIPLGFQGLIWNTSKVMSSGFSVLVFALPYPFGIGLKADIWDQMSSFKPICMYVVPSVHTWPHRGKHVQCSLR